MPDRSGVPTYKPKRNRPFASDPYRAKVGQLRTPGNDCLGVVRFGALQCYEISGYLPLALEWHINTESDFSNPVSYLISGG